MKTNRRNWLALVAAALTGLWRRNAIEPEASESYVVTEGFYVLTPSGWIPAE